MKKPLTRKPVPSLKYLISCEVQDWMRDLIDHEARERSVSRSDIMRWALIDRYQDTVSKLGRRSR